MPQRADKNRIVGRISIAARAVLAHHRSMEIIHFLSTGPSIRARSRLALAAAFLVAAPTLFIGVMRAEHVSENAAHLSEYDDYWKLILETEVSIKELELATWIYGVEFEFENSQTTLLISENLKSSVTRIVRERPFDLDIGPEGLFESLANRLDGQIRYAVIGQGSMAPARLSIISLLKEIKTVEARVAEIAKSQRKATLGSLARVGRDQLILFLVLLFAFPVFVVFMPRWMILPLSRLRQIVSKIERGQLLREMPIEGRDEVAMLTRSLKSYFLRRDELDKKKSSKIFEMRNILRSVISRVSEPVFIIDPDIRINFANEAASSLVGLQSHQMEGKMLEDSIYSPSLLRALEKVFTTVATEESIPIEVKFTDGRTVFLNARIGVVRNRDGEVSRAVVVLYQSQGIEEPAMNKVQPA